MNAQDYIRSLRCQFGWTQTSDDLSAEYRRARVDALESTGLYTPDQIRNLRTDESLPLEPRTEAFMEHVGSLVTSELAALGHDLVRAPTIGLLETRDFNAWATRAPNGDAVCLLDRHLWGTLTLAAVSLTKILFAANDESRGNDRGAQALLFAAMLQFARKHEHVAVEIIGIEFAGMSSDPGRVYTSMQIAYGMLLFVIAHEFAHHALRHLPSSMVTSKRDNLKIYTRLQLDEFAADLLGWQVFLRVMRTKMEDGSRRVFSQGEMAPVLLLRFFALYDSTFAETYDGASHPSWGERLKRLEAQLQKEGHPNALAVDVAAREVFKVLQMFAMDALAAVERTAR